MKCVTRFASERLKNSQKVCYVFYAGCSLSGKPRFLTLGAFVNRFGTLNSLNNFTFTMRTLKTNLNEIIKSNETQIFYGHGVYPSSIGYMKETILRNLIKRRRPRNVDI